MANFTKPMKWNNKGIEPSETLKNQGFKGGYKPPAEVFNYFLNNSEVCIEELQKATDNVQSAAESAGGAAVLAQAVANNAQSAADGAKTAADKAQSTADKAQSTAENAKLAAAEAQTTAEGKADSTHKHKKSDITDFPTSMTPTSHASTNTTYGTGNSSNYGHVKLSDSTSSTSGVSGGIAATPAAVKSVKTVADSAKTASEELESTVKELLKDAALSGSKLTFTKNNGEKIIVNFENATVDKDGQMSSTDKLNLDELVQEALTNVYINPETLEIVFSGLENTQYISLKDYFAPNINNFKEGTLTITTQSIAKTYNCDCGFEPRCIRIYSQASGSMHSTMCIYENGKYVYGAFPNMDITSTGFNFSTTGLSGTLPCYWEAWN